jgi:hypothetical protein
MTTNELLERISSVDFESGLVASTPRVLRQMLLRCKEVRTLRDAYDAGCLPDEQIRSFVNRLLGEGAGGDRFPYQTALAVIAVMFESRFTQFADEYLNDLARIRSDRFWIAARVARQCLDSRVTRIGTDIRQFSHPSTEVQMTVHWSTPADPQNGQYVVCEASESPYFQVA